MNEQEKNLHDIITTGLQRMGYIIDSKFNEAVRKIAKVISRQFDDYKSIDVWKYNIDAKSQINRILKNMTRDIDLIVSGAVQVAWEKVEKKNDTLLVEKLLEIVGETVLITKVFKYFNRLLPEGTSPQTRIKVSREFIETVVNTPRNSAALNAFLNRTIEGLNLSQRVWQIADKQVLPLIESYLAEGIAKGISAATIAHDLKDYLNEPNKLFRRVRDRSTGKLKLSVAAEGYHPGRGVYRSSYKNALRLAREEINQAYRTADYERWNQMDFIRGIKISLSGSHGQRMPQGDICDVLAGVYPKDFRFPGWHVGCLCYATAITLPEDDFIKQVSGEPVEINPVDIPDNFSQYLKENKDRIDDWKSNPYWIKYNSDKVNYILNQNG